MLAYTYTELVNDAAAYLDRDDIPEAVFKRAVAHAESKVNEILRTPAQEVVLNRKTDAEGSFPVPTDFLFMKRLSVLRNGREFPLRRVSYKEYTSLVSDEGYNLPQAFYREDGSIRVAPKSECDIKLVYYRAVPSILADPSESNWLIHLAPDLYFSAVMAEGYEFILNEEKAAYWNEKFKKAVARVQSLADRAEWDGSHMVVGSPQ